MKGIRITAGTLRGRRIAAPPGGIRPTSSRAREAVFNILADQVPGSRFLDLFAGTGIMSLEALSRGASRAVAVEKARRAAVELQKVAREWTLPLEVRQQDALRFVAASGISEPFDIVYVDPPYDFDGYPEIVKGIDRELPLADDGVVVIEHRKKRLLEPEERRRLVHRESRFWGQVGVEIFDVDTGSAGTSSVGSNESAARDESTT